MTPLDPLPGEASVSPLERDLAGVLIFVARVAVAIRMHSAYCGARPLDTAPFDLMWLADSLHNLHLLGQAVQSARPDRVVQACDKLLKQLEGYAAEEKAQFKSAPKPSFDRNVEYFSLMELATLLQSIRGRAMEEFDASAAARAQ